MTGATTIDETTRRSVEMFLDKIKGQYPIAEVWLYGSRARGDAREDSDADLAIILNGPKRRTMDLVMELVDAEFDIMMETGRIISTLPIAIDDWTDSARYSNPFLIANIKREGIRL